MIKKKAGCIIFNAKNKENIAIIHRIKENDYTFPKGHLENNEILEECAKREVKEETGLNVSIISKLPELVYKDKNENDVQITFFLAKSTENNFEKTEKGIILKWINYKDVSKILTYNNLKNFYTKHIDLIKKNIEL